MKFVQSLTARIAQYGVENVAGAMSGWLDRYSALASGDDMTLVFVLIQPSGCRVWEQDSEPSRGGT
jgi:hypothetical protein